MVGILFVKQSRQSTSHPGDRRKIYFVYVGNVNLEAAIRTQQRYRTWNRANPTEVLNCAIEMCLGPTEQRSRPPQKAAGNMTANYLQVVAGWTAKRASFYLVETALVRLKNSRPR